MFRPQDIQVSAFLTISWFTKSVILPNGAFSDMSLNIKSLTQLIEPPNLANWLISAREIIFRNLLNNLENWG